MSGFAMLLAAALVQAAPVTPPTSDPRTVVAAAARAVEGDSVPRVRARWERALRRPASERAARLGLATLARLTYDYPAAEQHFGRLVGADPRRDDAWAAYARLGRAYLRNAQGQANRVGPALDSVRAAATATRRPELAAAALLYQASDRPAAARGAALDSARALLGPADVQLRADVHCFRAGLDRTLGWEQRVAQADSGLAIARRAALLAVEGACLQHRAIPYLERGEVEEPIRILRAADSVLARANHHAGRAVTLYRLGFRYLRAAEHGRARAAFRTGAELADRIGADRFAVLNRWGAVQTALVVNDVAAAEEGLAQARVILRRTNDSASLRFARTYEGLIAQASGDDARARRIFERALPEFTAHESPANQHALLNDLLRSATRLRDLPAADRYLAQARAVAVGHGLAPQLAEMWEEEGEIALLRGDLARAERLFGQALAGLDSTEHAPRHGVRVRLAELHALRGDLARAERELRAAGDALDRWRATLEDQELRLLATEVRRHGGAETGVPRVLAALAAGGRAAAAFELAEQRRARELITRMVEAEALRETSSVEGARARVAREGRPVDARAIVAALPDHRTALLEFVAGARDVPTTLLVVTRGGVQAVMLPPADSLAAPIARLVALLEQGDDPSALARTLGAVLLDRAVAALGPHVERLTIVPDGPLHRVPFDALRLADGRYVVERFTVGMAPSATVAHALWRRERPATAAPPRVLAFGDPVFEGERGPAVARAGAGFRDAPADAGVLARLTGSGREARLVARYTPHGEARLRQGASEAYLKQARLGDYDVLHFATHALVDDRTIARTALALAPGAGEDGFLSPGDLAELPLRADLVVLSACRTAGGKLLGGEGVWGLTGPLLQAGARSVVATGWRVGDETTVRLVSDFYDALARGRPVAEALRDAKVAALRRGAPPGEWAAFTVVGDPLVTVPLQAPARTRWPLLLPLLLVGAAAAIAVGARRPGRSRATRAAADGASLAPGVDARG